MAAGPALAHTGGMAEGFVGGLAHPVLGPDHIVAMVAVGLWGAFLGRPAIVILPVVFPLLVAFGGVLGIAGMPLPGVEIGIALSAVMLGLAVALQARPPLWTAALLVRWPAGLIAVRTTGGFIACMGVVFLGRMI